MENIYFACLTLFKISFEYKLSSKNMILMRTVLKSGEGYGHRLRVFENRVLRRISGPKRDEVMGDWRKLHNRSFITCTSHQT
jgi:hypothetical protein